MVEYRLWTKDSKHSKQVKAMKDFRYFSSTAKILWGLWLLSPNWYTFATSYSYRYMEKLGNENQWGWIAFLIGLTHLLLVILHSPLEMLFRYISLSFWFIVAATILYGNIASPVASVFITIGLYEFLSVLDTATIKALYKKWRG